MVVSSNPSYAQLQKYVFWQWCVTVTGLPGRGSLGMHVSFNIVALSWSIILEMPISHMLKLSKWLVMNVWWPGSGRQVSATAIVRSRATCQIRKLEGCACAGNAGNVFLTYVPWCMLGSPTSRSLWSRWRCKRSRHSRCMRNPKINVSGKRSMHAPRWICVSQLIARG